MVTSTIEGSEHNDGRLMVRGKVGGVATPCELAHGSPGSNLWPLPVDEVEIVQPSPADKGPLPP
jgi:hypothetical protein